MANVVDSTQELTITLTPEGFGTIVSFTADKATAHEGDEVTFSYTVRNDGDVTDKLFVQIIDIDTGESVHLDGFEIVPSGSTRSASVTKTMPSKNWNLRLEAGHEE